MAGRRANCWSTWSKVWPKPSIAFMALSRSPRLRVRMNFSTVTFDESSAACTLAIPASPSALLTSSPTVPPISASRSTASSANTQRKPRTSAKPPKIRGRIPMRDRSNDRFMMFPGELRRSPDPGEQILAEALLEFGLQGFHGIDEGLAIDLLDDLHAGLAQPLELLRLVRGATLPGRLRTGLGCGNDGGLVGGLKALEHVAIGDEGDGREEMPGQAGIFLYFLEMAGGNRHDRVLLPVDAAVLQCGIDLRELHRHDLGAQRLEGHLIDLVRQDADLQPLEVRGRTNRPLRIGDVAKALLANREQHQSLVGEMLGE